MLLLLGQATQALHQYVGFGSDHRWTAVLVAPTSQKWAVTPSRIRVEVTGPSPHPSFTVDEGSPTGRGHSMYALHFNRNGAPSGSYQVTVDFADALASERRVKFDRTSQTQFHLGPGSDAEVETLRKKWVGRHAWLYGAGDENEPDGGFCWDPREPVTVSNIDFAPFTWANVDSVGSWDEGDGWTVSTDLVDRPIRITVQVPKAIHVRGYPFVGPVSSESSYHAGTPRTIWVFTGSEELFGKVLSTSSPARLLSLTGPRIRRAFVLHRLAKGMPRDLVFWLLGSPYWSKTGYVASNSPYWVFPGPAATSYQVEFDSRGRVSTYEMVFGKLP